MHLEHKSHARKDGATTYSIQIIKVNSTSKKDTSTMVT